MEVLQYIYTSWKNGDSTEKGYMIYSKSEGVTEAECVAIKDAMQYLAPKELNLAPTPEEIADVFPYSYSYFILPTGRGCVAQSTYLGRDYSGRFGNYIIYAMVFDVDELPCRPSDFFGEPYIKTEMTTEELEAPSPVPPLPPLSIEEYGSVINDDQLNEFIFDKEDEFAQVLSMILKSRDMGIPFYMNDTRENLVLWSAAVQRVLPFSLAKKFTYNTYMFNQDLMRSARVKEEGLDFYVIGVRPDANYFSYSTECNSSRHLVIDFLGGYMSEGVVPSAYSVAMASSLAMDLEEIEAFGEFIEGTSFAEINGGLQDAYVYYRLLRFNEYEHSEDNLRSILSFGTKYCTDPDNSDVGGKLLLLIQENSYDVSPELMKLFWEFVCKHSSYMIYSLYDLLQEMLFGYAGEAAAPCTELQKLLDDIAASTPQQYKEYKDYVNSAQSVDHLLMYLEGHENPYTNNFYIGWIMRSFEVHEPTMEGQPIGRLWSALIGNISRIEGGEKTVVRILVRTSRNKTVFENTLKRFSNILLDNARVDKLCACYVDMSGAFPEAQIKQFELMLVEVAEAAPLMVRVFAKKISVAKKPDEEFWCFYNNYSSRLAAIPNLSIAPMVYACLKNLDQNQRQEVATDMLRKLDLRLIRHSGTIKLLTDTVNDVSFKNLSKLDTELLRRTCEFRMTVEKTGADKIKALLVGQRIYGYHTQGRPVSDLSSELTRENISMADFSKSDYEAYVKQYFTAFYGMISSKDDVGAVMKFFYNERYFSDLAGDFTSALKKTEKNEQSRWMRIVEWTCVYLLTAPHEDAAANALYKPLVHYLRSVGDEQLEGIRREVRKKAPGARCDQMFDEVNRKEGFTEKLSGFFHRNK